MNITSTFYLPSERDEQAEVYADMNTLKDSENLYLLLNAMPFPVAILNDKRQIVFGNEKLLEILQIDTLEAIVTHRPGEAFE